MADDITIINDSIETPLVETVDTVTPDIASPDVNMGNKMLDNASGMIDKVKDSSKGFLNKWGGKGVIGAGAGLVASLVLFKSKSPVMMLVMAGGGFAIEKAIAAKKEKENKSLNDVTVIDSAESTKFENISEGTKDSTQTTSVNSAKNRYADNSDYTSQLKSDFSVEKENSEFDSYC